MWAQPDARSKNLQDGKASRSSSAAQRSPFSPTIIRTIRDYCHHVTNQFTWSYFFFPSLYSTWRVGRSINMCLSNRPGLISALSKMSARLVDAKTMTWSVVPIPVRKTERCNTSNWILDKILVNANLLSGFCNIPTTGELLECTFTFALGEFKTAGAGSVWEIVNHINKSYRCQLKYELIKKFIKKSYKKKYIFWIWMQSKIQIQ